MSVKKSIALTFAHKLEKRFTKIQHPTKLSPSSLLQLLAEVEGTLKLPLLDPREGRV